MTDQGQLFCGYPQRRQTLLRHPSLNGIDYLEIFADTLEEQRRLHLYFLKPHPAGLVDHPELFRVEGGVRIHNIRVLAVTAEDDHLLVETDKVGDFSTYELVIDHPDLDPVFARCAFSFKAGCPSRFDCRGDLDCPPRPAWEPSIDYLAKDYASFRRALLDLAPTLVPEWREGRAADLGTALVELLAYAADHLSYQQDAVANEAYLETARRRVSVRRHARLVDYRMHDGASARTFVQFKADAEGVVPAGTALLTRIDTGLGDLQPPLPSVIPPSLAERALDAAETVFETMHEVRVQPGLNEIPLHHWGNDQCCLPRGATSVDLEGDLTALISVGDFLLFEEVKGTQTGLAADALPGHRQVLRLVAVEWTEDPIGELGDPDNPQALELTRVSWDPEDALEFPLCLSVRLTAGPHRGEVEHEVSVARGNLALADHGRAIRGETHSGPEAARFPSLAVSHRLRLDEAPLSRRIPQAGSEPVRRLMATNPQEAEPCIELAVESSPGEITPWTALPHLLDSRLFESHFAVETEDSGHALLRFGDGEHGLAPPEGAVMRADYRVGVGSAGNLGAGTLVHLVEGDTSLPESLQVRNPLPAWGGIDPEPIERVKRLAPEAFRAETIRAVTEADYARAAERHSEVSKAVATFRWTGSWHTVFVTVDRIGGHPMDAVFEQRLRTWLERSRLAGYDLEIDAPIFVPLEIEIDICVAPDHFRGHVEEALLQSLGSGLRADGSAGFFHPDNFSFGQPVVLSRLYAALEAVEGVDGAEVRRFKRFYRLPAGELRQGYIPIGRREIARLDNDPSRPENGVLRFHMGGGK